MVPSAGVACSVALCGTWDYERGLRSEYGGGGRTIGESAFVWVVMAEVSRGRSMFKRANKLSNLVSLIASEVRKPFVMAAGIITCLRGRKVYLKSSPNIYHIRSIPLLLPTPLPVLGYDWSQSISTRPWHFELRTVTPRKVSICTT